MGGISALTGSDMQILWIVVKEFTVWPGAGELSVAPLCQSTAMNTRTRSTAQLELLDGGSRRPSSSAQDADNDWFLDERTRRVGLAGVAQAKAILQRVSPPVPVDGHRRAS